MLVATPAHAAHTDIITVAGSDTTELLMDNIVGGAAANEYNVHAEQSPAMTVPGDANCATQTYVKATIAAGQTLAPKGSSAGRRALRDSIGGSFAVGNTGAPGTVAGCVDIARSSAAPGIPADTDRIGSQYMAFALDNVNWASPSLNAPAAITLQQLKDIYHCVITNWAQIPGGGNGQIQRVLAQANSGTEATFLAVLGFNAENQATRAQDTATFGPLDLGCPSLIQVEENHGNYLTSSDTSVTPATLPALYNQVIMPYSAGKFVYQANNSANPTIDIRNGVRVGGITTTPGDPTTATFAPRWTGSAFLLNSAVVKESSPNVLSTALPGTRYLFNVIHSSSPSYGSALGLVGFDDISGPATAVVSNLCKGLKLSIIRSQGFLDIPGATTTGGTTGVTCRVQTTTS